MRYLHYNHNGNQLILPEASLDDLTGPERLILLTALQARLWHQPLSLYKLTVAGLDIAVAVLEPVHVQREYIHLSY